MVISIPIIIIIKNIYIYYLSNLLGCNSEIRMPTNKEK